ncbi:unnamed protein product, partial [Cyprideis torosa]
MSALDVENRHERIVAEFVHLLEKSKQLFNGLRDLPQYGHKQWQNYFGRTFDVYTKLWKFQQQHRSVLDSAYGLKRWQIGEIASKIGQLYYHYYLRTSETNYLNEAYSFYSAIRSRAYYSRAVKEERSDLMVKKLRYYARFIVVCLLLRKNKTVRDLIRELAKHIDDYTTTYEPEDQLEWSLVLGEIRAFMEADAVVRVLDQDSSLLVLNHRLSPQVTPPVDKSPVMNLSLQEALIVGNCNEQLMLFLASAFRELPPYGVLLLYLSADPCYPLGKQTSDENGYECGGVATSVRRTEAEVAQRRGIPIHDMHCFYPGDLWPFTRRPLFLIVDSENSQAFLNLPRYFGQPFVALLSAVETPSRFHESLPSGNIMTLFLHSPLSAFCFVCGIVDVPVVAWDAGITLIARFMAEGSRLITRSRAV